MSQDVYVISDLHLGGEPGFQICSPAGQALLADFVRWVTARHRSAAPAHLVLAGDVVDFLAESPAAAFTASENEARDKLERIFSNTRAVWDALAAHGAAGAPLTLMIGNHDIELALSSSQRALRERLGPGATLRYDDEALRIGELLVEHGNRHDDWNRVDHDQLRAARRALAQGGACDFEPQPGSKLVVKVINKLKRQFPFIDLLKPETHVALPLLAWLHPQVVADLSLLGDAVESYFAMLLRSKPVRSAAGRGVVQDWMLSDRALGVLRSILRDLHDDRTFDVGWEDQPYRESAEKTLSDEEARAVVFGHTHLAKRVRLGGGTYLNSGTFADLMKLPDAVFQEDAAAALEELRAFVADLRDPQRSARLRRQLPTFACVALDDGDRVREADVYCFAAGRPIEQMRLGDGKLPLESTRGRSSAP